MAGSYAHCTNEDGTFIGEGETINEGFTGMIENLGDAYEACEEMHWMIDYLAEDNSDPIGIINEASEAFYAFKRREG